MIFYGKKKKKLVSYNMWINQEVILFAIYWYLLILLDICKYVDFQ